MTGVGPYGSCGYRELAQRWAVWAAPLPKVPWVVGTLNLNVGPYGWRIGCITMTPAPREVVAVPCQDCNPLFKQSTLWAKELGPQIILSPSPS